VGYEISVIISFAGLRDFSDGCFVLGYEMSMMVSFGGL